MAKRGRPRKTETSKTEVKKSKMKTVNVTPVADPTPVTNPQTPFEKTIGRKSGAVVLTQAASEIADEEAKRLRSKTIKYSDCISPIKPK